MEKAFRLLTSAQDNVVDPGSKRFLKEFDYKGLLEVEYDYVIPQEMQVPDYYSSYTRSGCFESIFLSVFRKASYADCV